MLVKHGLVLHEKHGHMELIADEPSVCMVARWTRGTCYELVVYLALVVQEIMNALPAWEC